MKGAISSKCSAMMGLQIRLEDVDENENVNKDDDGGGDGCCSLGQILPDVKYSQRNIDQIDL